MARRKRRRSSAKGTDQKPKDQDRSKAEKGKRKSHKRAKNNKDKSAHQPNGDDLLSSKAPATSLAIRPATYDGCVTRSRHRRSSEKPNEADNNEVDGKLDASSVPDWDRLSDSIKNESVPDSSNGGGGGGGACSQTSATECQQLSAEELNLIAQEVLDVMRREKDVPGKRTRLFATWRWQSEP